MLVRHDPYPKGAGLDCLRFLRPSTYAHRVRQTATKLCTVIKKRENFTESITPPALAKIICDSNADARSVCGS